MKALVTGGAGYIGSILVPQLLSAGFKVTVIDNFLYGQSSLLDVAFNENLKVIKGDVRDFNLLDVEVAKADLIIPLASLVGAPICEKFPLVAKEVNCEVIKRMNSLMSSSQAMIYPCTNSGYGVGEEGVEFDETSELNPISTYGRVKVEAESFLLDKGNAVCFRFATLFGSSPRMRLDLLVNDFTYKAMKEGKITLFEPHFKRNFLHVRDAAAGFEFAINNYNRMKGQTFNLGLSDANLSKQEVCDLIREFLPEFNYEISENGSDPDQRNYIVSNQKIEEHGFKAQRSLPSGISELIKVYHYISGPSFRNELEGHP